MKKKAIAYKPPVHKKLQIKHMLYKKKRRKKKGKTFDQSTK